MTEQFHHPIHVAQNQTQLPILVVEDDNALRSTIVLMLEEEGFIVQSAADGREAVEQALVRQPVLLVLDMSLPFFDGYEVASQVRRRYGTHVPIVLMTADGHAHEKSRRVGATSYLHKPFDLEELIQAIQHILREEGHVEQGQLGQQDDE